MGTEPTDTDSRAYVSASCRAVADLTRFTPPISDALVLAALDRAQRHGEHDRVPIGQIVEHLGHKPGGWATRCLRPQLLALATDDAVREVRAYSMRFWTLTPTGKRRLDRARRTGEPVELPEAPQHRIWRHARAIAAEHASDLQKHTAVIGGDLERLLHAQPAPTSRAWLRLAEQLFAACWALGETTHCLHEWQEPNDRERDHGRHRYLTDALERARESRADNAPTRPPRGNRQL